MGFLIVTALRSSLAKSPRIAYVAQVDEPPPPAMAFDPLDMPPDEPAPSRKMFRTRSRSTPVGNNQRKPLRQPHDERPWSFPYEVQQPASTRGPLAARRLGAIPRDFVTTDVYEAWVRGGPSPEIQPHHHCGRAEGETFSTCSRHTPPAPPREDNNPLLRQFSPPPPPPPEQPRLPQQHGELTDLSLIHI